MRNVPQPPPFAEYGERLRELAEQYLPDRRPTLAERVGSAFAWAITLAFLTIVALGLAALAVLELRVLA